VLFNEKKGRVSRDGGGQRERVDRMLAKGLTLLKKRTDSKGICG
jgi:hypothetical protein